MQNEVKTKVFPLSEAESFYCDQTHKLWIAARREDPDGVNWYKLNPEDRKTFGAARQKEVETLIDKGALRKLSVSQAKAFEKEFGAENILDSGFVDKWKTTDDGMIAKSRHVIKGWQDPMILQIERTAPAPAGEDEAAVMQVIASEGWEANVGDVRNAFGQSRPSNRSTPIACRQPPEGIPGMLPGEILLCITECYGLVSGPAWWRSTFTGWLMDNGYKKNPFAPCLMMLPCLETDKSRDQRVDGVLCIRTDDVIEGGEPRHRALMEKMKKAFEFGKYKRLLDDPNGTLLSGRRVKQLPDKGFAIDMDGYLDKIKPVKLGRKLKANDDGTPCVLEPHEVRICRGVNGGISWLGNNGRPDLSAAASMIPRGFTENPGSDLVSDLNFAVSMAHSCRMTLRIWPIAAEKRRFAGFFDASFDRECKKIQLGRIIGCCSPSMHANENDTFSMGFWKSQKLEHSILATSPNYTETKAAKAALADIAWYKSVIDCLTWSDYDPGILARKGQTARENIPYVISSDDPMQRDPWCLLIGDSKGVFDNLNREQPGAERYSALDAAYMKIRMAEIGCKPRWLPHDSNPADALTKFRGAHAAPLHRLVSTGKCKLAAEADELARKAEAKATLGYIPRPKTGILKCARDEKLREKSLHAEALWALHRRDTDDRPNFSSRPMEPRRSLKVFQ